MKKAYQSPKLVTEAVVLGVFGDYGRSSDGHGDRGRNSSVKKVLQWLFGR